MTQIKNCNSTTSITVNTAFRVYTSEYKLPGNQEIMKKTALLVSLISCFHMSTNAAKDLPQESCTSLPTVIESTRVFDGSKIIPVASVVIQCGLISDVTDGESSQELPEGTTVIDGRGKTLLPGLMDAHVHTFRRDMLERMLDFGVTTVFDMGSVNKTFVKAIKNEDLESAATDRADLFSGVLWATAPGSHGTQFGEIPTHTKQEDATEWVAQRAADGADFIKIIYDNFKMFDRPIPTLSKDTLFAIVEAAHAQNLKAVVHSRDVEAYTDVVAAGADGFVHLMVDELPGDALIESIKNKNIFVSPNLSLARHDGLRLVDDPSIGPMLSEEEIENLGKWRGLRREGGDQVEYDAMMAFHRAGVMILAGSDSPNGGTVGGASIHLELELMVQAGMSAVDALSSATSRPALAFGLGDRGQIKAGMKADLVLVNGKPDQNIKDTRKLAVIWKAGVLHK